MDSISAPTGTITTTIRNALAIRTRDPLRNRRKPIAVELRCELGGYRRGQQLQRRPRPPPSNVVSRRFEARIGRTPAGDRRYAQRHWGEHRSEVTTTSTALPGLPRGRVRLPVRGGPLMFVSVGMLNCRPQAQSRERSGSRRHDVRFMVTRLQECTRRSVSCCSPPQNGRTVRFHSRLPPPGHRGLGSPERRPLAWKSCRGMLSVSDRRGTTGVPATGTSPGCRSGRWRGSLRVWPRSLMTHDARCGAAPRE